MTKTYHIGKITIFNIDIEDWELEPETLKVVAQAREEYKKGETISFNEVIKDL